MDKRDFYRELMEQYTFDKDKIYLNAKKGKTPWNRLHKQPMPIYLGMTAAVAAVVVTVGTITASNIGRTNITHPLVSGSSVAALQNDERIKKGQNDARDNEGSKELVDVLVSFERPLSSAEVQRVLLARSEGSVPIGALYFADGVTVVGTDNVANVFEENGSGIIGAKIRCAGYLMSELQNDSLVLAVEIADNDDPEQMTPIITNTSTGDTGVDSVSQGISSETESSSVSTDNSFESSTDGNGVGVGGTSGGEFSGTGGTGVGSTGGTSGEISANSSGTGGTSGTSGESSSAESSGSTESGTPSEPSVGFIDKHIHAVDAGGAPALTGGNSNQQIALEVMFLLGNGGTLPFAPDNFSYLTENINAEKAYFLNDNTLYVRTADDIRLYSFDGAAVSLIASAECPDTTVFWIAENGGRLLALGEDGKLYDVNANTGTINAVSLNTAGTIREIAYNEDADILALNVFENGIYSLKVYDGGFEAVNGKIWHSGTAAFDLLAADYGVGGVKNVFFAMYSENGDLTICRASDFEKTTVISNVEGSYEVASNAAFTHAVLKGGLINLIFDPSSGGLIGVSNPNVQFGISRHSFYADNNYYTIANGNKSLNGSISVIGKLDFKRSLSRNYMAAAEDGAVRIVNGIYTDRAGNDYPSFETPADNASSEMHMAVNAAIGIQNAFAKQLCAEYGITERTKAVNIISACFTESAANELKSRCAIDESKEEGETFEYTAGVKPINLSEYVLTISEETETGAVGTLYVSAGTFGGKTAYYSYAVKLLKTDNGYKADAIIE